MSTQRTVPELVQEKLSTIPEHRMGVHRVTLVLKDGRRLGNVIIAWERELISVDGQRDWPFDVHDIVDVLEEP